MPKETRKTTPSLSLNFMDILFAHFAIFAVQIDRKDARIAKNHQIIALADEFFVKFLD